MFIEHFTDRQLEAALVLRGTSHWQAVSAGIDEELKRLSRSLRDATDFGAMRNLQGSIKALESLQDLMAKAQDTLEARSKRRGAGSP